MKFFKTALILSFFFYFQVIGLSYTRVYLLSEVEVSKDNLVVSDICKMEGDNVNSLSKLVIPQELYSDSIVDNRELFDFLSSGADNKLFIFGSGVNIKRKLIKEDIIPEKIVLVEKGWLIDLSIKKNGITIEMKGKALNNGCENDEIDFRLTTGKVVKGKIVSDKKADVIL